MSNAGESSHTPNEREELTVEQLQAQISDFKAQLEKNSSTNARLLEESKKFKEAYHSLKSEKEANLKKTKDAEEDRLKKEGQFNVLLEQRERQIAELEESLTQSKQNLETRDKAIVNFKKGIAFEKALGGKLKKDSYWKHVDFENIAINPDNGEIDVASLKSAVDNFSEEYKELIDYGNRANLPNGTASGTGKLTYEQWKALPLAERKKRMKDVQ